MDYIAGVKRAFIAWGAPPALRKKPRRREHQIDSKMSIEYKFVASENKNEAQSRVRPVDTV